jgi:predicted anti-sigma-YlaC factor YlaD
MNEDHDAMNCEAAREFLSAAWDGEAVRTAELGLHLESCSTCREFAGRIGALSTAFAPLRGAALPASLSARALTGAADLGRRPTIVRETSLRVAAALVGLVSVGAIGAALSARTNADTSASESSWLEPLAGRALHPADDELRLWSRAAEGVVNGDRK